MIEVGPEGLSLATVLRLRVKSPELATTVAEIDALVKRGANLTRQLLLFSQHEVTKKERIDLGETVRALSRCSATSFPRTSGSPSRPRRSRCGWMATGGRSIRSS